MASNDIAFSSFSSLLSGRTATAVKGKYGRKGLTLRLLSAAEVLDARREAAQLAQNALGSEKAICSNACLLARALEQGRAKEPVFQSGAEALAGLKVEEIADLAQQWADFNDSENPSPEDGEERTQTLKKAWSTRLMNALNGACSAASAFFPARNRRGR